MDLSSRGLHQLLCVADDCITSLELGVLRRLLDLSIVEYVRGCKFWSTQCSQGYHAGVCGGRAQGIWFLASLTISGADVTNTYAPPKLGWHRGSEGFYEWYRDTETDKKCYDGTRGLKWQSDFINKQQKRIYLWYFGITWFDTIETEVENSGNSLPRRSWGGALKRGCRTTRGG